MADGIKMFLKEDPLPGHVNKFYFLLAPVVMIMPALAAWAVVLLGLGVRILRHPQDADGVGLGPVRQDLLLLLLRDDVGAPVLPREPGHHRQAGRDHEDAKGAEEPTNHPAIVASRTWRGATHGTSSTAVPLRRRNCAIVGRSCFIHAYSVQQVS